MQAVFKFLIKDKVIPVQPFDKLMIISKNIRNDLIFSSEHSYQIESKVQKEIVEEFIKYIIFDETPEISINNINEYETLSEEFSIMKEMIMNKKNEFGEYLINLNGLSNEDERMPKIDFSSLNELFSAQRKQEQMLDENFSESLISINKQQEQNEFKNKKSIEKLENKIEQIMNTQQQRQKQLIEEQQLKYSKLLASFNRQQEQQESKYKKSIELLENKIEQLITVQQRKQEQLIEEQKTKYSELLATMSKQQNQQEAKYKKSILLLENKIEQLINSQQTIKDNIETKFENRIKNVEREKENLNNLILEQNSKITKLEEELEYLKTITIASTQNKCQPFITKLDKSSPGILQRLKNNEKSPFDHLFIPSQSSNDIYNIIDPNTNDEFCITDVGKHIELELEESITINGIKLFSSKCNFPKSFDIEIDNKKVASSLTDSMRLFKLIEMFF